MSCISTAAGSLKDCWRLISAIPMICCIMTIMICCPIYGREKMFWASAWAMASRTIPAAILGISIRPGSGAHRRWRCGWMWIFLTGKPCPWKATRPSALHLHLYTATTTATENIMTPGGRSPGGANRVLTTAAGPSPRKRPCPGARRCPPVSSRLPLPGKSNRCR